MSQNIKAFDFDRVLSIGELTSFFKAWDNMQSDMKAKKKIKPEVKKWAGSVRSFIRFHREAHILFPTLKVNFNKNLIERLASLKPIIN